MKLWDLVAFILGILLAILTLIVGITKNFFGLVATSADAIMASTAVAIFFLLVGYYVSDWIGKKNSHFEIKSIVGDIIRSSPSVYAMIEFSSSDNAMDYLCSKIPLAAKVLNTKISKDSIPPRRDIGDKYVSSIKSALKKNLIYKDIISSGFESYARDLKSYSSGDTYQFAVLDSNDPSFLNFIILEYKSGEEELLVGWATSQYMGTEQKAYSIKDSRLIAYFKNYHSSLYQQSRIGQ